MSEAEVRAAVRAMQASRAWPVVFAAGSANLLARAALEAAEKVREREKAQAAVESGDR